MGARESALHTRIITYESRKRTRNDPCETLSRGDSKTKQKQKRAKVESSSFLCNNFLLANWIELN